MRHVAGEWSEVIEGFLAHIHESLWINHPARNTLASHKIEQLSRAAQHGLAVPRSLVTNSVHQAEEFILSEKNGVVVKPLATGFIERADPKRDTVIYTSQFTDRHLSILGEIECCPVLFQEMIKKVIDVRVTILDGVAAATGMRAIENDGIQRLDIRRNNMSDVEYSKVVPPQKVFAGVESLSQSYGLRFATLDFAITESGQWFFFEINPNGQWAWLDLCGATDIAGLFVKQLKRV